MDRLVVVSIAPSWRQKMIRATALVVSLSWAVLCCEGQIPVQEKPHPENLILQIEAKQPTFAVGERPAISITVKNQSKKPMTLVLPGDGSESGWRTPVIAWSVLQQEAAKHPKMPRLYEGGRCGNINALKRNEVFVLGAGESKNLGDWAGFPSMAKPGAYRVVFYYTNEPTLKWQGLPLGQHDSEAMKLIQQSHQCTLVSNELTFVVKPKE
jgi:hypothetical protein